MAHSCRFPSWLLCAALAVAVVAPGCRRPADVEAADASASAKAAGKSRPGLAGSLLGGAAGDSLHKGWVRPPLIDYHAHLGLDGLDRIAQIVTENGIEAMVNLSGGSYRHGTDAWAEAKLLADRLPGRIYNFMNPDWSEFGAPGWGEREALRLEKAVNEFGFRGLKIAKALGLGVTDLEGRLVSPDDPRLGPLWRKAADLGIPVSIHVADPRAFWETLGPENERWDELGVHPFWSYADRPEVPRWGQMLQAAERLYRAHPKTTFVAVHFGNAAEDLDYVDGLLRRNPNVWIDTSARVGEFGRHSAAKVRAFFVRHQNRILFGTDIGIGAEYLMLGSNGAVEPGMGDVEPFYLAHFRYFETKLRGIAHPSPIQGRWTVDAIDLPTAILEKLYRGNALRILDRSRLRAFAASQPATRPPTTEVPAPAAALAANAPGRRG